jgi:hypothetical protein
MAKFASLIEENRGTNFVPIKFEVAPDLSYWSATIPGKITVGAEALTDWTHDSVRQESPDNKRSGERSGTRYDCNLGSRYGR